MKSTQLLYAVRNLLRKKKQTLFTGICIGISSLIILANIAFNNSLQAKLKTGINEGISGQLTVFKSKKKNLNILESQIKDQQKFNWTNEETDSIKKIRGNVSVNKRIRFGSIISFGDETSFVSVHALERDHLERLKKLLTIKKGAFPNKDNQIMVSESLSEELFCSVGDTLLLLAENTNNYMSDDLGIVSGVFEESGLASFFDRTAFAPYKLGENIVQLDQGEALELVINPLEKNVISETSQKKIENFIDQDKQGLQILPWNNTVPLLYVIVKVWKAGGYFTQVIFTLFSLIVLLNFSALTIDSRKKEFGTLNAIGFSWSKIMSMICFEYLIIAALSVSSAYLLFTIISCLLPEAGLHISSKDLQTAVMTTSLEPFLTVVDFLYVLLIFMVTIIAAITISVNNARKSNPLTLINS